MSGIPVSIIIYMTILPTLMHGSVNIKTTMKSFSHAHKVGTCESGKESILFERAGEPGVITEQWFTGKDWFNRFTTIRYYIDGDVEPSIEVNLNMMHGVGNFNGMQYPPDQVWGTKWIGHLAQGGAQYNTIRIPYQKSINVTFVPKSSGPWWFILRGVENYPVVIGDLELPPTAKLVVNKIEQKVFQPYSYITLGHSRKSGMLFMVTLAGESSSFEYLEGCYRLLLDNDTSIQYMSSGTEDFFLSAYYFNKGLFYTDHSGLTAKILPGTMSAYKYFVADPILFHQSFDLIWRVGEKRDNNCYNGSPEKCYRDGDSVFCVAPNENNDDVQLAHATNISSYVWFYEW